MNITIFSIFTAFVVMNGLMFIFMSLMKTQLFVNYIDYKLLWILLTVIMIKFFVPTEFAFSILLEDREYLPIFFELMNKTVISFNNFDFFILNIFYFFTGIGVLQFVVQLYIYYTEVKNIKKSRIMFNDFITDAINMIVKEYGIKQKFNIYKFEDTPAQFGFFSINICLPEIEYIQEDYYYAIKHEYAHFKFKNGIIKLITLFMSSIFFWNPVVVLFCKEVNIFFEIHIDNHLTLNMSTEKTKEYLNCIKKTYEFSQKNKSFLISGLGRKKFIKQRFLLITNKRRPTNKIYMVISYCLQVLILLTSLLVVIQPKYNPIDDNQIIFYGDKSHDKIDYTTEKSEMYIVDYGNSNGEFRYILYNKNDKMIMTMKEIEESYKDIPIIKK